LTSYANITDNVVYNADPIFPSIMNGTLFQKDATIKRVTTLDYHSAQALNDPLRIRILEILSHNQMNTEEIAKILGRSGHKKAITTIRHHLETLKNSGLIEVTKVVEVRGAVMKYYMATLRAFSYTAPNLEKHSKLIDDTSSKLFKILKNMLQHEKFAASFSGKDPCSLCKAEHYKEYVALEILNAALARALTKKEYQEILATREQHSKS
jgi:DNA-binding transcriptional ArsR family regulator